MCLFSPYQELLTFFPACNPHWVYLASAWDSCKRQSKLWSREGGVTGLTKALKPASKTQWETFTWKWSGHAENLSIWEKNVSLFKKNSNQAIKDSNYSHAYSYGRQNLALNSQMAQYSPHQIIWRLPNRLNWTECKTRVRLVLGLFLFVFVGKLKHWKPALIFSLHQRMRSSSRACYTGPILVNSVSALFRHPTAFAARSGYY